MNGNQSISGRYEAILPNSKLELRLDVDDPRPMNKISGDIFSIDGNTINYFGSFIVNIRPPLKPFVFPLILEGSTIVTTDEIPEKLKVTINTSIGQNAEATVEFINSTDVAELIYIAQYKSPFFREILWEQDVQSGITPFDKYDTSALPSGGPQRSLTVESAYEEAGVKITPYINGRNSIVNKPVKAGWSDAELNDVMIKNFDLNKNNQNQIGWKVWSFATSKHIIPDNAGVMFDTKYENQRQGFAVFYDAIRSAISNADKLDRYLLYTNVHELGHCFNLMHSYERRRASALTWMNYPIYYTGGRGGVASEVEFWNKFAFQFDDIELNRIRHGFYSDIVMGGNMYSYNPALEMSDLVEFYKPVEGDPGLNLRLESKQHYRFGEPVVVEIKISATDPKGASSLKRIHPKFGFVRFAIQKPNGDVFEYKPIIDNFIIPSFEKLEKDKLALYDSAYIGYGKDGFYFDQIGNYRISGLFYAPDGSKVVSNPITIRVKPPFTATDDKIAELYFGDEQGKLFYLLGSDSYFLKNGNNAFKLVIDKYKNHPMSIYANLVLGNNQAREFKSVNFKTGKITSRKPERESARKNLNKVKNASMKTKGIDNITLNMVYTVLTNMYRKEGDNKAAKAEAEKMVKTFKAKKLNRFVTENIKKQAIELVNECK